MALVTCFCFSFFLCGWKVDLGFYFLSPGKYMYIEASAPRKLNDHAFLASEMLPAGSATCFHFWYNMYGSNIYILRVWVRQNSNGMQAPIFELKGQQSSSSQWLQGQASIPAQSDSFSVSPSSVSSSSRWPRGEPVGFWGLL